MPSRIALSPVTTSKNVKARPTSGKENATLKESRVPKPKALNENPLVRMPSEGRSRKPVGPRKPPPTLTPEKKRKVTGTEKGTSPKKPLTTITRGAGRALADLSNTKANPNTLGAKSRNSNTQSTFTSPNQITSFFTSPDTTALSMNLNIHGDSYASDSVWLNRTTETGGKNQNESSFASLGKGSVKDRWMDWERERERLREMDKDKIRETDDEDTNRLRRSIMTVVSEPEPDACAPLETDLDVTLEFAPVFRSSEEWSRRSVALEGKEDVVDVNAEVEENEKETEHILGRRRESQGSRILQTLLAAEPVTVLPPPVRSGRFRKFYMLRIIADTSSESGAGQQPDHPPGLKNGLPVPRSLLGSGMSALRQSVKASIGEWSYLIHHSCLTSPIDKSVQLYRTSTLLSHGRHSVTMTMEDSAADYTRIEQSTRQSWEDESLIRQGQPTRSATYGNGELTIELTADCSLPAVRQMVRSEKVGEDNYVDRMSLWLQSVESEEPFHVFIIRVDSPLRGCFRCATEL